MKTRVLLPLLLLASALPGCQPSRTEARDRTAEVACRRFESCEGFGEGKTYPNRDDCLVRQRSFWNDLWPADRCEQQINAQALETCHKAIEITDCRNVLDIVNTAFSKCGAQNVCVLPPGN